MSDLVRQLRDLELQYRDRSIATPADSSLYETLDELRTFTKTLGDIFEKAEQQKESTSGQAEAGEHVPAAEGVREQG